MDLHYGKLTLSKCADHFLTSHSLSLCPAFYMQQKFGHKRFGLKGTPLLYLGGK